VNAKDIPTKEGNKIRRNENNIRGCPEKFSASTIDDNTIGKIFFPKLVYLSQASM
jgi:hypothetical protein